jgi:hypothetical protein
MMQRFNNKQNTKAMNKIFVYAMLAGLVTLTACSKDDAVAIDGQSGVEIKLALQTNATRATNPIFTGTEIPSGTIVYVWANQKIERGEEEGDTITPFIKTWRLIADGDVDGNLTSSSVKTFPSQNRLFFYVLKGNFDGTSVVSNEDPANKKPLEENVTLFPAQKSLTGLARPDSLEIGIVHTLLTDQQKTNANAFTYSDLIYGETLGDENAGIAPSPEKIRLQGYHMLSMFEVVLHEGYMATSAIMTDPDAHLHVVNLKTQCFLTPDTIKGHNIYGTNHDEAFDITNPIHRGQIIHPIGNADAIEMDKCVSNDFNATNLKPGKAIVVPQTIPAGTTIIRLTLPNGDQIAYKTPAALTLKSGYKYRFNLTINDGHEIILDPTYVSPNTDYTSLGYDDENSDGWAEVDVAKTLEEATEQQPIELDPTHVGWNDENRDLYMQ